MSGDDIPGRSVWDVTRWLMQEFYNSEDFMYRNFRTISCGFFPILRFCGLYNGAANL